jgi:hypothetical protein
MADSNSKNSLTPAQADDLIGAVGTVRNPSKGVWEGEYRCTGYTLDPADDGRVKTLKLESLKRFVGVQIEVDGKAHHRPLRVDPSEIHGRPVAIPERPVVVAPHVDPRWFKPNADAKEAVKDEVDFSKPPKAKEAVK